MPYCPGCGVETEYNIKNCPLCNCKIPKIEVKKQETDYLKEPSLKFPKPENIYSGKMIDIKKYTFYAITSLFLLNILLLIVIQLSTKHLVFFFNYPIFVILSIWFYLLIFFGFIKNKKVMISVLIVNTLFFTFLLDLFNGLYWFIPVFLPSTILASIILIIMATIIRLKKKRTFNLIFSISIAISTFLIGVQSIFSFYKSYS